MLCALLEAGCASITPAFKACLERIPTASVKHVLETAFGYMEILLAGVHQPEVKQKCFVCLLRGWSEYLASTFVENAYAEMNDLLNRVELTVAVWVCGVRGRTSSIASSPPSRPRCNPFSLLCS